MGLGGMLGGAVVAVLLAVLKAMGAEAHLWKTWQVPLLDVAFQQGQGQMDNPTVDAPG